MKAQPSKNYDHNPDHFRFRRSLDWQDEMVTDYTPSRSPRSKILWTVLAASLLILLMIS